MGEDTTIILKGLGEKRREDISDGLKEISNFKR